MLSVSSSSFSLWVGVGALFGASFAGSYATVLGVTGVEQALAAAVNITPLDAEVRQAGIGGREPLQVTGELSGLRVVTHRQNQGYGAALKTGFTYARHEVVVITDRAGTIEYVNPAFEAE